MCVEYLAYQKGACGFARRICMAFEMRQAGASFRSGTSSGKEETLRVIGTHRVPLLAARQDAHVPDHRSPVSRDIRGER
jgi:hypothetical protein